MNSKDIKVLFTSAGRRVELIQLFKKEGFITFAADSDPTAPTLYMVEKSFVVPRVVDNSKIYINSLLNICKKEHINLIIPLIDPELPILAKEKRSFLEIGTVVVLSSYKSVTVSSDKFATYDFFKNLELSVPETLLLDDLRLMGTKISESIFPAILKPMYGSAGQGIMECPDLDWLNFLSSKINLSNYILQKKVSGEEITIDVFGDGTGKLISAVQRKRLKVRGGEVERGITVKYPELFVDAQKFAEEFKPFGPVNLQCFYDKETGNRFYTEINARFGGGYPLSYNASANFIRYLRMLLNGEKLRNFVGEDYDEGIVMARFDNAVYKNREDLLKKDDSSF